MTKKYKREPNLSSFSDYAIRNLPEEILINLSLDQINFVLQKSNLISTFSEDLFVKLVQRYINLCSENTFYHQQEIVPVGFYSNLPTTHINRLG